MHNTNAVISVVDDDASVRSSLNRLLRSMGFKVRAFASGAEFLQHGPLHEFGCAIVDIRMPDMNGLDLQKKLSDSGITLPIIFITAYEDPGARIQAMQAGAVALLRKPFSDPLLMASITLALECNNRR